MWRKAVKLSIRAEWLGKDFTCRLQWNSLGYVRGGKPLNTTPEEELWHAVIPRLMLSSPPNCTYCILVIVWGGTVLFKKKSHSAYWWLLYFITMLNELGPRLLVQTKMLLENTCNYWQLKPDNKDHGVSATSVSLSHQCLDKSFFLTENSSSVQTFVWCHHFAFCCNNKTLTPLLSF